LINDQTVKSSASEAKETLDSVESSNGHGKKGVEIEVCKKIVNGT
jgi:hypothetical protein